MKAPSKNISKSLKSQSPAGNRPVSPSVSRPKGHSMAQIPGEGNVSNPPGTPHPRSSKPYAGAVGRNFGNGR